MCVLVVVNISASFFLGNNIYGEDVREALLRLHRESSEEDAAYILMQRIFPSVVPTLLIRDGICHKDHAISELGIYGAYLRLGFLMLHTLCELKFLTTGFEDLNLG